MTFNEKELIERARAYQKKKEEDDRQQRDEDAAAWLAEQLASPTLVFPCRIPNAHSRESIEKALDKLVAGRQRIAVRPDYPYSELYLAPTPLPDITTRDIVIGFYVIFLCFCVHCVMTDNVELLLRVLDKYMPPMSAPIRVFAHVIDNWKARKHVRCVDYCREFHESDDTCLNYC
jgi:hypothetical protein